VVLPYGKIVVFFLGRPAVNFFGTTGEAYAKPGQKHAEKMAGFFSENIHRAIFTEITEL
jgi:hypothetical protein